MGKYTYLLKNIGLLTLSQFATKFLSFFLVPLYTSVLTTADYGTFDLLMTTVGLMVPILTLNIQDAVLRYSLDESIDHNAVVTVGVRYFIISNILVVCGLLLNDLFAISSFVTDNALLLLLVFFCQALSGVVVAYTRGIGKIADLSITSVMASAVTIICNILFLLVLKLGITGYFWANILGPVVQSLCLIQRSQFLKHIQKRKFRTESRKMTAYSKPMIANNVAWWVNNASDRYVVTFFCGLEANGIYSIAGKIPSILNIVQSIFAQAWVLSVVKNYDREDKDGFFTNTYKAYNCIMVILCSGIILANKWLATLLYAKEFYMAWKYVPWLTIAIVFGSLAGYLGGFFAAAMESKLYSASTVIGAVANTILNLLFTPIYGAMGAAVATMISYAAILIFRHWTAKKFIKLKIDFVRDIISYVLLTVQATIGLLNMPMMWLLQIGCCVLICVTYKNDIALVMIKLRNRAV